MEDDKKSVNFGRKVLKSEQIAICMCYYFVLQHLFLLSLHNSISSVVNLTLFTHLRDTNISGHTIHSVKISNNIARPDVYKCPITSSGSRTIVQKQLTISHQLKCESIVLAKIMINAWAQT